MDASKVTIGQKTYDLNFISGKRKTAIRRKLIVEYIQSKPAGQIIKIREFKELGHFSSMGNTHTFLSRMIRDGQIAKYQAEKPNAVYYSVLGAVRVTKPKTGNESAEVAGTGQAQPVNVAHLSQALNELALSGLQFILTIKNVAMPTEVNDEKN